MKISRSLLKAKIKIFDECIFNTNKKVNYLSRLHKIIIKIKIKMLLIDRVTIKVKFIYDK